GPLSSLRSIAEAVATAVAQLCFCVRGLTGWLRVRLDGPRHWKDLAKGCGGDNQSPINIDRRKVQRDSNLGDLLFEGYDQAPPGKWRLMNNGHTGGYLCQTPSLPPSLAPQTLFSKYRALQFHFHWGNLKENGSEHTIDGHQFPMELHLVHMNTKYKTFNEAKGHPNGLAVLGFLYKPFIPRMGFYDDGFSFSLSLSLSLALSQEDFVDLASTFCLNNLLPSVAKLSKYYRYQGSLTTPDCTEVVVWTLFEEPIPISQSQVKVPPSSAVTTALVNPAEGLQFAEFLPNPSSWAAVQGAEILSIILFMAACYSSQLFSSCFELWRSHVIFTRAVLCWKVNTVVSSP
uniref:Carbonic anhydrase n=1 Tax=Chelydra serpentina TaxID=8475 RepID=A0A8C3RY49_CHESE